MFKKDIYLVIIGKVNWNCENKTKCDAKMYAMERSNGKNGGEYKCMKQFTTF